MVMSNKQRPHKPGPGRPKGSPNKVTRALREAILEAAETVGDNGEGGITGYCVKLARDEPRIFAGLLGRVLPLQAGGDSDGAPITLKVVTGVPRAGDDLV